MYKQDITQTLTPNPQNRFAGNCNAVRQDKDDAPIISAGSGSSKSLVRALTKIDRFVLRNKRVNCRSPHFEETRLKYETAKSLVRTRTAVERIWHI